MFEIKIISKIEDGRFIMTIILFLDTSVNSGQEGNNNAQCEEEFLDENSKKHCHNVAMMKQEWDFKI